MSMADRTEGAIDPRARQKLSRLERAAVAARAIVCDVGDQVDAERQRLQALEVERAGWGNYVGRVYQEDIAQHEAKVAAVTAELARLTAERDELQQRAQALGAVVDTARRYLGVHDTRGMVVRAGNERG